MSAGAGGLGPAVGGADGEDEALGAVVAQAAEVGGELFGGEEFAAGVEEDEGWALAGGVAVEGFEEGGFGGVNRDLGRVIAICAGRKVPHQQFRCFAFAFISPG